MKTAKEAAAAVAKKVAAEAAAEEEERTVRAMGPVGGRVISLAAMCSFVEKMTARAHELMQVGERHGREKNGEIICH